MATSPLGETSIPVAPVAPGRRGRGLAFAVTLLLVGVIGLGVASRAPTPRPIQLAADPPQPSPTGGIGGLPIPQLLRIDEARGLPGHRLQIRFTVTPRAFGSSAVTLGSGPPYTWTVTAPSGASGSGPANTGDWAAPPLARGALDDPDRSFTVNVPCGQFSAFPVLVLDLWSRDGAYFPLNTPRFTVPPSCPRLAVNRVSPVGLGLDATGHWPATYQVGIAGAGPPVGWSLTAYRWGVPNDRGMLLASQTSQTGAATRLGHRFTCDELLRYGFVRLVATDRVGVAGWSDFALPRPSAC